VGGWDSVEGSFEGMLCAEERFRAGVKGGGGVAVRVFWTGVIEKDSLGRPIERRVKLFCERTLVGGGVWGEKKDLEGK